MNPRQGNSRLRLLAVAVAVCALISAWAPAASADEVAIPTTQARAYNADWVPYLDPPEKPAAVCLVDSGVNITPDTPADSPDGPIVKRLALDGGPGTAAGSSWEALHGTRMAMVGAAPINGWGAVGFWPGLRIISIRAMAIGATSFPFDIYSRAADLCTKHSGTYNVAAINLSLDCDCMPTDQERDRLAVQIANAHNNGQSVVVAAGNNGGVVGSPANAPGTFAVAAGDITGGLCAFSNRGTGIDIIAPGCGLDLADAASGERWSGYQGGTSGASISTSTVLALLRSYRTDLGWRESEELIRSSGQPGAGGPWLDVSALFRAAGLSALIDAARKREPAPASAERPPPIQSAAPTLTAGRGESDFGLAGSDGVGSLGAELATPHVVTSVRRGAVVTIRVNNLPPRARLVAELQRRRGEFGYRVIRRAARRAERVTLRIPRDCRGARLALRYERAGPESVTSREISRRIPR